LGIAPLGDPGSAQGDEEILNTAVPPAPTFPGRPVLAGEMAGEHIAKSTFLAHVPCDVKRKLVFLYTSQTT
jgi:hypothetical protein